MTKKFVTGDYVGDPYSCVKLSAHPCTRASGRIDKIEPIFIYNLFIGGTHLQVRPVDGVSGMMAQTTRLAFWGFVHRPMAPHLGGQYPHFGDMNRHLQTKLAKSKNVHIIKKLLKFCTVLKTTKCPSWVVQTHASPNHDGGRPPSWKNRHISATV